MPSCGGSTPADYGPLATAARGTIDLGRIRAHWPDLLRLAGSIHTGAVSAHDVLRTLAHGGNPTQLGEALAHYGRIFKTLHVLSYVTPVHPARLLVLRGESARPGGAQR